MALLVTQAEALRQLRLVAATVSAEELADVMFKATQASDIVLDYLKRPDADQARPEDPLPDPAPLPWTEATAPNVVKSAVLSILTALYDGRTPLDELLSPQLCAILHRFRDPALA